MTQRPLAISTGDPGGVGPEIALQVALAARQDDPVLLFGDAAWLAARAGELGVGCDALRRFAPPCASFELAAGQIGLVEVGVPWNAEALAHHASAASGLAQLRALDAAIAAALSGKVRGLVTAPMSKEAVNLAGFEFTGHTEHLARAAGLADDAVSMLFLGPRLRVGLVTTHVSIVRAPAEITVARVLRTILHTAEALLRDAGDSDRRLVLAVAGLNPHAGEAGLFGDEEQKVLVPAMEAARSRAPFVGGRIELRGPVPAETAFRLAASGGLDAIVAMLHDQATIASKLLDWGEAVNVTWGLPFVRTSVDHGVAYDAAASGKIDSAGMFAALALARRLTRGVG